MKTVRWSPRCHCCGWPVRPGHRARPGGRQLPAAGSARQVARALLLVRHEGRRADGPGQRLPDRAPGAAGAAPRSASKYQAQGVEFLLLNSNLQDKRDAVAKEAKEFKIDFPILLDESQLIGESLGVVRTSEVFVIDPKGWKLEYRGPMDDRLSYERQRPATNHYLTDALDAVLAGQPVKDAEGRRRRLPGQLPRARHARRRTRQISYSEADRAAARSTSASPATRPAASARGR